MNATRRVPLPLAILAAAAALLQAIAGAAEPATVPSDPQRPPTTILDLQPFRTETAVAVQAADGRAGTATLTNLNPHVNGWFVLTIAVGPAQPRTSYHLEIPPPSHALSLATGAPGFVLIGFGDHANVCTLAFGGNSGAPSLESARRSGLPFVPLCDGRLYLRNQGLGRSSMLERVTGFLRDYVWGGEQIVTFVKKEFYRDAFREQADARTQASAGTAADAGPMPAELDPAKVGLAIAPPHLGLELESQGPLAIGRWYALHGVSDVYFSSLMPGVVTRSILYGHESGVNPLTDGESSALVYLIAFDLARFDLRFAMGTEHPRLGWAPHTRAEVRDARLAGPDGIDNAAPLAITGMVAPGDAARTVATFTGGFKREHGAFSSGRLAQVNHGSHYGFIENGVVFSTLQPGLATIYTTLSGEVRLETWQAGDPSRMAGIRDARQNGVPLVDYDPRTKAGVPGALVNVWGAGNWSGSANADLRTVRAGICVQQSGTRRFLLYAYFSSASPSAMARVFQAYHCAYAMHMDMNALEHTYLAVYMSGGGHRTVEHLIVGMDVLDRSSHGTLAPRFIGFPDNRDFFYLLRRPAP